MLTTLPGFTVKMRYGFTAPSPRTITLSAVGPMMLTFSVRLGNAEPNWIVTVPEPGGILNVMLFVSTFAFAAVIASRREQSASQKPSFVSAVLVTTKFGVGSTVITTSFPLPPV